MTKNRFSHLFDRFSADNADDSTDNSFGSQFYFSTDGSVDFSLASRPHTANLPSSSLESVLVSFEIGGAALSLPISTPIRAAISETGRVQSSMP
jgi:hypothetical protein